MSTSNNKFANKPFVLWFTGLSGSGKSTVADEVFTYIKSQNILIDRLDGDIIRDVFPQTGFSKEERNLHIQRVGFVASRLVHNGISVVASFISPYQQTRDFVRNLCNNFIEIYISTPLETCEERDVKGLYKKARKGDISNFTGISDPYEAPRNPELTIDTAQQSIQESTDIVINYIKPFL